jgi:hypothetical protein
VRLLAASATNVSTSEGSITEVHNLPYLSETTKKNHVENCSQDGSGHDYASPQALQVSFPAGAYTVDDGAVHDFQMSMELDPSAKLKRATNFKSGAVDASCSEISRWRPGEWKPGFPFTLYVMQCRSTTSDGPEGQSTKTQRTMYFSPELSAELTCGASETSDAHGLTMQHSTFNTEVTTEGKVTRVKCALSASTYAPGKGSHSAANVSKGEVEEVITLH